MTENPIEDKAIVVKLMYGKVLSHDHLKELALTSAALIIHECKNWNPNTVVADNSVLGVLYDNMESEHECRIRNGSATV